MKQTTNQIKRITATAMAATRAAHLRFCLRSEINIDPTTNNDAVDIVAVFVVVFAVGVVAVDVVAVTDAVDSVAVFVVDAVVAVVGAGCRYH